mgnify:FL=1
MKQIYVVYDIDNYGQVTILAAYEEREQAELLHKNKPHTYIGVTYLHFKKIDKYNTDK